MAGPAQGDGQERGGEKFTVKNVSDLTDDRNNTGMLTEQLTL